MTDDLLLPGELPVWVIGQLELHDSSQHWWTAGRQASHPHQRCAGLPWRVGLHWVLKKEIKMSGFKRFAFRCGWIIHCVIAGYETYLSAKRELGKLLHWECIKWLPSGVDLHSAQHHDDNGHDQSQESTGIDNYVAIFGLHCFHSICCFLLCKYKKAS